MIFKLRFGKWKLTITLARIVDVIGVNSSLADGNHILLWDFDGKTLNFVEESLKIVQLIYDLPTIYVLETKPRRNYIAYCFARVTLQKAAEIIASTKGICWNFFKWGVIRGRFTLRVTSKGTGKPKLALLISSPREAEATIEDLNSWVQYETLPDGKKGAFILLGERRNNR